MKRTWTQCTASAHLYMRCPTHRRDVKLITPAPHTECPGFQLMYASHTLHGFSHHAQEKS